MVKLLNILTLVAVVYFVYWMIKRKFRQRQLAKQGIVVQQQGMRPITLFSIVMVSMYAGYMLWYLFQSE
ncbi:hypothetical protein CYQ88_10380 [Hydrogenovibrio sp. SC-1]|uniref:hypothetical protein n=1 Tax=Hydrogenovibrio sp. SC-1 TaxID=2065820 RepID=UPI000C7AB10E|nr:hypothetical protein [Hydrogenovibrio sp. SC-1]PLA73596.1 hypothetical protein CYQ88_10380 [Hydrogenovibrio sp. SC-1]